MITTAEFAYDAESGRVTSLVLQRTPTWAVFAQRVTDRVDEATAHRWCRFISGRIDHYVLRHSRYATVPVDVAMVDKITSELRTNDLL